MPELPACFQDYNHFGYNLKPHSVLSGSTNKLQKPDNKPKIIFQTQLEARNLQFITHLTLPAFTT
jgi:hypothetical protein